MRWPAEVFAVLLPERIAVLLPERIAVLLPERIAVLLPERTAEKVAKLLKLMLGGNACQTGCLSSHLAH